MMGGAPTITGMPAPSSFALGTFADTSGREFPALVVGDRAGDLSDVAPSVAALLQDWAEVLPHLRSRAGRAEGWQPLCGLTVRPPLQAGQVFQAGANYRTH